MRQDGTNNKKKKLDVIHKTISNKKGLSFLETMVTVAVVAMITSIAIPSFNRYRRSSSVTEAKVALSDVYMNQKSFRLNYGGYTTDLVLMGIRPEGRVRYNVGFSVHTANTDCKIVPHMQASLQADRYNYKLLCGKNFGVGKLTDACAFQYEERGVSTDFTNIPDIPAQVGPTTDLKSTKPAKKTGSTSDYCDVFTAAAIADLKVRNPSDVTSTGKDIWSVNQNRVVTQEQDGT